MIDDLLRLVPPPRAPVHADGDWAAVRDDLGLALPGDYRALVTAYGLGQFGDIGLLTPFAAEAAPHADLRCQAGELLDTYRDVLGEIPYPLYPRRGGLVPWGGTGNGVMLCWLTEGDPETWPVVVFDYGYRADRYEIGAAGLLHGQLSGRGPVTDLDEVHGVPWFDPFRERDQVSVRLSGSGIPYEERLRLLRAVLGPTAGRGAYRDGENRQDHFKAVDRDWLLTYETAYGHQLRVAFPREDAATARRVITAAVDRIGCTVLAADWPR